MKAWTTGLLNQRAKREAGFTEQRKPLALNSGGITCRCTS
ncbi:SHOOT1 protein [Senna tora]|uniref:SHOOT1 protein n=1 Tax=Senna tora TaxID=362788 RepID=A0A834WDT2_9FABA|nr:SHOOT1 protein [Senna tora]